MTLKKSGKFKEVITKCDNLKMAGNIEAVICVLQIQQKTLQIGGTKLAPPKLKESNTNNRLL